MTTKNIKLGFKKKIALSLFQRFKKNATKLHELNYLFWECTLRCNFNCLHCGSDCKKDSTVKDMPISDFLRVIDQIKPTVNSHKTMIVFTGGEPLARKDLEECGLELYKREFPWGLVTNAYFLTKQRFESLLQSGLRSITISLDGLEKEHDWFRDKKGSFKRAINAIEMVAKEDNLVSDVVTCVNQQNISQLPEIKKKLIEIGVKKWRLFTITPIGRAKNNPLLLLDNQEFKSVFEFIKECRKEGIINVDYGCEGFLGNYESEVRDNFFFCRAGINVGSILADGSISACPNLRSNFTQGNIYKDNFVDVWENKYQIMRDRSWTKTGKCKTCKHYKYCQGNGLHLRNEETGELYLCHLEKLLE